MRRLNWVHFVYILSCGILVLNPWNKSQINNQLVNLAFSTNLIGACIRKVNVFIYISVNIISVPVNMVLVLNFFFWSVDVHYFPDLARISLTITSYSRGEQRMSPGLDSTFKNRCRKYLLFTSSRICSFNSWSYIMQGTHSLYKCIRIWYEKFFSRSVRTDLNPCWPKHRPELWN
jgi:hypothetical protein